MSPAELRLAHLLLRVPAPLLIQLHLVMSAPRMIRETSSWIRWMIHCGMPAGADRSQRGVEGDFETGPGCLPAIPCTAQSRFTAPPAQPALVKAGLLLMTGPNTAKLIG